MAAWTKDQKQRARERAFAEWTEKVLSNPERYSPLKLERYRQNLTQKRLGALPSVRLDKTTISQLERGASKGTKNTRARLAYALNRPEQELFPR
jgi:DNA-binding XRE family transcriptional regulator